MAKVTYDYKNVNIPEYAVDIVDIIKPELEDLTGVKIRKADIWLAALSSFNEQTNEKQLEILRSLGINC